MTRPTRPFATSRRRVLGLLGGLVGLAAGTAVTGRWGVGAASSQLNEVDAQRAVSALLSSAQYGLLGSALVPHGFSTSAPTVQSVTTQDVGVVVTLVAGNVSDTRAAFVTALVTGAGYEIADAFATVFESSSGSGDLTTFSISGSGGLTRATEEVTIKRRESGEPGTQQADYPGGGCTSCCSGWRQISYYECSGCSLDRCYELEKQCCCCNNAANCWYEYTGRSCSQVTPCSGWCCNCT